MGREILKGTAMLQVLDHVNIRTANLAALRRFYSDVLGLKDGARPPFKFGGAWLYCGEQAVVHLVPPSAGIGAGPGDTTGNFDHVAFVAEDFEGMRDRFKRMGLSFRENEVPGIRLRQLFVQDPNKVMIELNFPAMG